jgi:hypothetical protein
MGNIALDTKKVKRFILKPQTNKQTNKSEIKGINSLHVTSLSSTEVPRWSRHTLDS